MVDSSPRSSLAIALIGADALLAARPATPVQVLHGCLDAGFAAAYPVTWGDELVARECLARLSREAGPRVALCSCPLASRRVEEANLPAERLAIAAPPVAAARLVRAAYGEHPVRITFIGGCPSAIDPAIDAHVTPSAFLDTLGDRGIVLTELPDAFEAVLPPDRRRFLSVPGGAPACELLAAEGWTRVLCENGVEHSNDRLLIDLAPVSGCACAGASFGREAVEELEPPRSQSAVVDPLIAVDMRPTPAFAPAAWRPSPPTQQEEVVVVPVPPAVYESRAEPTVASPPELPEPPAPVDASPTPHALEVSPPVAEVEATARVEEPTPPAIRGEVVTGEPPHDELPPWDRFEPRVRAWTPEQQVIIPEDVGGRPRGLSGVAITLAVALGITLPLAAFGAWVLWRSGPSVVRAGERNTSAGSVAVGAAVTPEKSLADSVPAAAAADSAFVATPPVDSTAADSAAATTEAADSPPPRGRPEAPRERKAAATSPQTLPRVTPILPRPMRDAVRSAANPRSGPDTASDATINLDTSRSEREALRRDIAIRRARADSLARVVDSLKRVRPRQLGNP